MPQFVRNREETRARRSACRRQACVQSTVTTMTAVDSAVPTSSLEILAVRTSATPAPDPVVENVSPSVRRALSSSHTSCSLASETLTITSHTVSQFEPRSSSSASCCKPSRPIVEGNAQLRSSTNAGCSVTLCRRYMPRPSLASLWVDADNTVLLASETSSVPDVATVVTSVYCDDCPTSATTPPSNPLTISGASSTIRCSGSSRRTEQRTSHTLSRRRGIWHRDKPAGSCVLIVDPRIV